MIKNTWDVFRNKEDAQKCYDICLGCEFYHRRTYTCKKCGCFVNAKVKVKSLHCPIDKW